MTGKPSRLAPAGQTPLRHALAFAISGVVALAVDGLVLKLLTVLAGLHPIAARVIAICLAMVAGWLMHRTFTFRSTTSPSVAEFMRYAGVAWTAAAVNYAVFAVILLARPATEPLVALVVASAAAMVFAYLGMRFAAFRRPAPGSQD
jgi:putative flippase GtrA